MVLDGRTAPRAAAMDTFRWGSGVGGTSLGEWEHNSNKSMVSVTCKNVDCFSSFFLIISPDPLF